MVTRSRGSRILKLPYMLVLVAVWLGMKSMGISTDLDALPGLILLGVALVVGFLEVYKGADIGQKKFNIELGMAIVVWSGVLVYFCLTLLPSKSAQTGDWVILFMAFIDLWFSPAVAYATSLRNFAANMDPV